MTTKKKKGERIREKEQEREGKKKKEGRITANLSSIRKGIVRILEATDTKMDDVETMRRDVGTAGRGRASRKATAGYVRMFTGICVKEGSPKRSTRYDEETSKESLRRLHGLSRKAE
ncbi:hypothetical protein V1478_016607 [Vespula squamosa]|uniref:Uncharacterized protein n=1 Tax=Vespula squamosa TaxID=30214 RepID=A0ABD2A2Y4_VESSQ